MPWGGKKTPGGLHIGGTTPKGRAAPEHEKPKGSIEKALLAEGRRRKAITQLEKQLESLKKNVKDDETPAPKRRKKAVKEKKGKHGNEEEAEGPFAAGGRKKKKEKEPDSSPSPDWGGDDDSAEEESSPGDTSGDGSEEEDDPDDHDPGGREKGKGHGDGDKKKKAHREKKNKKKRKKEKKKKKKKHRKGRLERDKGPFGVGETRRVLKDEPTSDEDGSDGSDGSSQSFRKAPSGLTLHLRLQRYAMKHPGRLASRLLQKMERATRFGGARRKAGAGTKVVPCAVNFYLAIMTPSLKDKWTPRTQRELRIWTEILDCLAAKDFAVAADIAAQRVKALEQSVQDGNQWRKAMFLELVDSEEVTLADKGEANMMQKELELEDKLKGKGAWNPPTWDKKGKGGKDGKGKDHKGKKETPAGEAAKKGDK